jgi:hypothetical protein
MSLTKIYSRKVCKAAFGDQFKEKDLLNNFEGLEEIPPLANEQMSRTSVI